MNFDYEIISFINERKVFKLLLKDKVKVISIWSGRKILYINGYIDYPAVIKMKYLIKLNPTKLSFSRKLILRRDEYICCYCDIKYPQSNLTIDHVIPKSLGGENSFTNCVTACLQCNRKKGSRTLEQSGMKLKNNPDYPSKYMCCFPLDVEWHDSWVFYI